MVSYHLIFRQKAHSNIIKTILSCLGGKNIALLSIKPYNAHNYRQTANNQTIHCN